MARIRNSSCSMDPTETGASADNAGSPKAAGSASLNDTNKAKATPSKLRATAPEFKFSAAATPWTPGESALPQAGSAQSSVEAEGACHLSAAAKDFVPSFDAPAFVPGDTQIDQSTWDPERGTTDSALDHPKSGIAGESENAYCVVSGRRTYSIQQLIDMAPQYEVPAPEGLLDICRFPLQIRGENGKDTSRERKRRGGGDRGARGGNGTDKWDRGVPQPTLNKENEGTFKQTYVCLENVEPLERNEETRWKPTKQIKAEEADNESAEARRAATVRQARSILNKLSIEKFEALSEQFVEVGIEDEETLSEIILLIIQKAQMETPFCEMYASLCLKLSRTRLAGMEDEGDQRKRFRRTLLKLCEEEFGKEESKEGWDELSVEDREEKELVLKLRTLGHMRFIGELYKQCLLSEKIVHFCLATLVQKEEDADEEDLECACKLLTTVGKKLEMGARRVKDEKIRDLLTQTTEEYFELAERMSTSSKLSTRLRFMMKDLLDLRKNDWVSRRKEEKATTIKEVHMEAERERLKDRTPVKAASFHDDPRRDRRTPMLSRQYSADARRDPRSPRGDVRHTPYRSSQRSSRDMSSVRADETLFTPDRGNKNTTSINNSGGGDEWVQVSGTKGKSRRKNTPLIEKTAVADEDGWEIVGSAKKTNKKKEGKSSHRKKGVEQARQNGSQKGKKNSTADRRRNDKSTHSTRKASQNSSETAQKSAVSRDGRTPAQVRCEVTEDMTIPENDVLQPERIFDTPVDTETKAKPSRDGVVNKAKAIVDEHLFLRDQKEAVECFKEVSMEGLKVDALEGIMGFVLEKKESDCRVLGELLLTLVREGVFSTAHVGAAADRIVEFIEDIEIDVPLAQQNMARMVGFCARTSLELSTLIVAATDKMMDKFKAANFLGEVWKVAKEAAEGDLEEEWESQMKTAICSKAGGVDEAEELLKRKGL